MKHRTLLPTALALLALPDLASAQSTRLDIDQLNYETVDEAAQRALLAVDSKGRPLTLLLRIGKGQFLPPHGGQGGIRLLTVVSGTLSWGDGDKVDPAAERSFGPGSLIVIPATGGEHWAAARQDDVLLQIVKVQEGALAPAVKTQVKP